MLLYIFSVAFLQTIQIYLEREGLASIHPDLLLFYGTVPDSMLALFMAITGGTEWKKLLAPLEELSQGYSVAFAVYVTFAALGVLNVFQAIFVESVSGTAVVDHRVGLHEEFQWQDSTVNKMKKHLTQVAEQGKTGCMCMEDLEIALADPKFEELIRSSGFAVWELKGLFQLLDTDTMGLVDIDELLQSLASLKRGKTAPTDLLYSNKRILMRMMAFTRFAEDSFRDLREALAVGPKTPGAGLEAYMPATYSSNTLGERFKRSQRGRAS